MIRIHHPTGKVEGTIELPSSKSVSNRMLILRHLYEENLILDELSEANDTQLLQAILTSDSNIWDVQDAGTAFRFLVAYASVSDGSKVIQGTSRLHERPIDELVNALRQLGANIEYLEKENYAPLKVTGSVLEAKDILDLSNVKSSQFISALLMISPKVKGRLRMKVNTKMSSFPYIQITIAAMRRIGFSVELRNNILSAERNKKFNGEHFKIEPDWSSFFYWYSIAHLSEGANLFFPDLSQCNMQKERELLFEFGCGDMQIEESNEGIRLVKLVPNCTAEVPKQADFKKFPDLIPTFAMLFAAMKSRGTLFTGLKSLKYKESNRELAIEEHLKLVGSGFAKTDHGRMLRADSFELHANTLFPSYEDHRMAMCAAPLALHAPIRIEDEWVVKKSYPSFWRDLEKVGFEIEYL